MKTKKIILTAIAPIGLMSISPVISSCAQKPKEDVVIAHTPKFFKTQAVADTVYVYDYSGVNKNEWYVTIQSLQGILAQNKAEIFIKSDEKDRNAWFEPMKAKMGFKTVDKSNPIELLNMFKNKFNGQYVVYRKNKTTPEEKDYSNEINIATTIAAAENIIMVDKEIEGRIQSLGFTQKYDAADFSTKTVFEKFKDKLNNSMLINQNPTNIRLRDYAIASKSFTTYLEWVKDIKGEWDEETFEEILKWSKDHCPLLGWNDNEVHFVEDISQYNKVITASDHCCNLSFYSAFNPNKKYKQKRLPSIKAQKGKHYVAIVMSDGDNIQWLQGNFSSSEKYYGSKFRGNFPITWTMSPAPYDVNGNVLDKIYDEQKQSDNFVCGPSGFGYINYDAYAKRDEFAKISAQYMEDTDMKVANFIDFYGGEERKAEIFDAPMKQSQITGGIWSFGNWYIEGQGGVHWRNNKPVVCAREALWEIKDGSTPRPAEKQFMSIDNVANRINSYSTDPTSINGYTIVLAHVWSYGEMNYVNEFVKKLDKDHVELVTGEQIIDLISQNVAHTDVLETEDNAWKHKGDNK